MQPTSNATNELLSTGRANKRNALTIQATIDTHGGSAASHGFELIVRNGDTGAPSTVGRARLVCCMSLGESESELAWCVAVTVRRAHRGSGSCRRDSGARALVSSCTQSAPPSRVHTRPSPMTRPPPLAPRRPTQPTLCYRQR